MRDFETLTTSLEDWDVETCTTGGYTPGFRNVKQSIPVTTKSSNKSKKRKVINQFCKDNNIIRKTDFFAFEPNIPYSEVLKKYKDKSSDHIIKILTIASHHYEPEKFLSNDLESKVTYNFNCSSDKDSDGDYFPGSGCFHIGKLPIFSIRSMTLQCGMRSLYDIRGISIPYRSYEFEVGDKTHVKIGILCLILGLRELENIRKGLIYIASDSRHGFVRPILKTMGEKIYTKQNPNTGAAISYFILDYQTLLK